MGIQVIDAIEHNDVHLWREVDVFLSLQSAGTVIGLAGICNAVSRSLHNAENRYEERACWL